MPQTVTLALAVASLLGGVFLMWLRFGYTGDVLAGLQPIDSAILLTAWGVWSAMSSTWA